MSGEHPFLDPESLRRLREATRIDPKFFSQFREATRLDPAVFDQARAALPALKIKEIVDDSFRMHPDTLAKLHVRLDIEPQMEQLLAGLFQANQTAVAEAIEALDRHAISEAVGRAARASLDVGEAARLILAQRLRDAAAGTLAAGPNDVFPDGQSSTLSLEELADLYQELPKGRKRDLRDRSAATAIAIGRYIEALLDQDDLSNAGWLLLQVLVFLLALQSSVANAIDALEEASRRVTVTTSRGSVELPWASRSALLDEIRHLDSATGIVKAFTDVGATRPVTLSDKDRALLFELLEFWSHRVGYGELPAGVWDLRCAIADDLDGDPPREELPG